MERYASQLCRKAEGYNFKNWRASRFSFIASKKKSLELTELSTIYSREPFPRSVRETDGIIVFFFLLLKDKFEKSCHLFAHLVYIACRIVPQASQRISILLLDVFNQCLQAGVSTEDSSSSRYLSGIISMIPQDELRGTMNSTMEKILSKNVSKEIKE